MRARLPSNDMVELGPISGLHDPRALVLTWDALGPQDAREGSYRSTGGAPCGFPKKWEFGGSSSLYKIQKALKKSSEESGRNLLLKWSQQYCLIWSMEQEVFSRSDLWAWIWISARPLTHFVTWANFLNSFPSFFKWGYNNTHPYYSSDMYEICLVHSGAAAHNLSSLLLPCGRKVGVLDPMGQGREGQTKKQFQKMESL